MKMKSKQLLALLAVGAVGFGLTGCAANDEPEEAVVVDEEVVEEPAEEPTPEETEAETDEPTSGGAGNDAEVTPPGTELAIGESAIVQWDYTDEASGLVKVTAVSITQGEESDLDELDLGENASGMTPYYVEVEVEGLDDASSSLAYASPSSDFDALLENGEDAVPLIVFGSWDKCPGGSTDSEFGPGQVFTTCVPGLSNTDMPVAGLQWAPYEGDYNSVDGEPIVWME